ncbi:hypothetical protein Ssa13956_01550 [Streptococcus salivarius]
MIHPPILELIIATIISKLKSHKTPTSQSKIFKIKIRKLTYKKSFMEGLAYKWIKKDQPKLILSENYGSIISVVGKTTVEIIELFECRQKVP